MHGHRIGDAPIHVTFCGEMNHSVEPMFLEQSVDEFAILDIASNKLIVSVLLNVAEVFQVARVRQQVEVHDLGIFMILQ